MPRTTGEAGFHSLGLIRSLQLLITLYEGRTGSFPERLDDLGAAGLAPYLGSEDAWKQPIRYTRRVEDFELRSAGPDGQFRSTDDIIVSGRVPMLANACRAGPGGRHLTPRLGTAGDTAMMPSNGCASRPGR